MSLHGAQISWDYWSRRVVAAFIDLMLPQTAGILLVWPVYGEFMGPGTNDRFFEWAIVLGIVQFLIAVLFNGTCEWKFGAAVGKWIFGLRVRSAKHERLSLGRFFFRNAVKVIESGGPLIVFFIANIGGAGKSLGDHFAKTRVVRI